MTTALYRRYRPDDFAEVIGQEHVTGPLMQALRSGRITHAYLFSGPRGCGKTTSARILARCLNCAQGPTPTPCGECESCVELARGGSGSLDVVEIDAASHGGVDDARDLRERATFAPARDRFKIFILDEAHMVTSQGFNALLKIVEEPPPHIKFIFATTEPDKVIGTIRSRTHHYPFRLVPPDVLGPYLEQLCAAEGVTIGAGVVPLVVRAGGGSVRDSLSVMDQLIAGAEDGTVDYDRAVALLGFTHAALLDDVVDALAARDGASMFRVVDHVVSSGHEPRRFVEDLLERLRDLVVIGVSGESADAVFRDLPADQLGRMRTQAQNLGVAELSRAADLTNAALTEMSGATSPRLHLELLCARLLVPGAAAGDLAARVERLERDGAPAGGSGAAARPTVRVADAPAADAGAPAGGRRDAAATSRGAAAARAALQARRGGPGGDAPAPASTGAESAPAVEVPVATVAAPPEAASRPAAEPAPAPVPEPAAEPEPVAELVSGPDEPDTAPAADEPAEPVAERATEGEPSVEGEPATHQESSAEAGTDAPGGVDSMNAEMLRRRWPEVLDTLNRLKRLTWILVSGNGQVGSLTDDALTLAFSNPGAHRSFQNGPHAELVQQAVYETLGFQARVVAVVGDGGPAAGLSGDGGGGSGPQSGVAPSAAAGPAGGTAPAGGAGWDDADLAPAGPSSTDPAATARTASTGAARDAAQDGSGGEGSGSGGPRPTAVGLLDRPAPAPARAAAVPDVTAPDTAAPGAAVPGAADAAAEADAAWLAGAVATEPPFDDAEPGPAPVAVVEAPRASAAPPGQAARQRPSAAAAAIAHARRSAGAAPAATSGRNGAPERAPEPAPDDFSDDDPDLATSGLVGVPLVIQALGGVVIEEIVDGE
ncbi:DNA polymerase III subunit gamma and tau [Cellulomonas sp. PhB143]|uniref:DNA polymerase III subunit gamma and tau n=1 Tax=Cellulomonas sp. PhB143 TaxID=2485186 RepID=UPI000F46D16E|nr:DNA polymerase III subunit gamma and tau [Cellulomonas sp. PhB143]ROS78903.1 DNA polymerase-3 subunit gamma/tau [Cellulomonas sp. PhB143]